MAEEAKDRLEAASEETKRHEEARSLDGGNSKGSDEAVNNVEREEEGREPVVRHVQRPVTHTADKADKGKTSSARSAFWAQVGDGRVEESRRANRSEQKGAFEDYEARPDIESRESILAREQAAPGEYSVRAKKNGDTVPHDGDLDDDNVDAATRDN